MVRYRSVSASRSRNDDDSSASPSPDPEPEQPCTKSRFSFLTLLVAHPAHVVTYLVCVALFSISFLVFVNSTVSFVITDRLGGVNSPHSPPQDPDDRPGSDGGVGNAVGTLGFADEIVTLVACPMWGLLSDRVGVRPVVVSGYIFVSLGLVLLVMAHNVFPQLLLARLVFSLGAAAMTTMITAMLPTMTYHASMSPPTKNSTYITHCPAAPSHSDDYPFNNDRAISEEGNIVTRGVSEATITPVRFRANEDARPRSRSGYPSGTDVEDEASRCDGAIQRTITLNAESSALSFRIAGILGAFAGFGALLALFVFLPLPPFFQSIGQTPSEAVQSSYFIVASIALTLAFVCFFGLRNLPGEEGKNLRNLVTFSKRKEGQQNEERSLLSTHPETHLHRDSDQSRISLRTGSTNESYYKMFSDSLLLGFKDSDIGIGYISSFVARASSVTISLFIPLLINIYFRSTGRCGPKSSDQIGLSPDNIHTSCPRAYAIAAALTGSSQLIALLSAPIFGYLSSRETLHSASRASNRGRFNTPLLFASVSGMIGFSALAIVRNPDPFGVNGVADGSPDGDRLSGNPIVFLYVALMGLAQIGATVCGLGLLARGIQRHAQNSCASINSNAITIDGGITNRPCPANHPDISSSDGCAVVCPFRQRPSSSKSYGALQYSTSSSSSSLAPAGPSSSLPPSSSSPLAVSTHKGTIGSVSSLAGACGILVITKVGGLGFDKVDRGFPFIAAAGAFALLFVVILSVGLVRPRRL